VRTGAEADGVTIGETGATLVVVVSAGGGGVVVVVGGAGGAVVMVGGAGGAEELEVKQASLKGASCAARAGDAV